MKYKFKILFFIMDDESKIILQIAGFEINDLSDIDGLITPRSSLISDSKYEEVKALIPILKKHYSSSLMTSLQTNAENYQRWPLLNLVRQILNVYNYKMEPIRKADGYTLEGVKKYKRYFQIKKRETVHKSNHVKKNEIDNNTILNDIILVDNDGEHP
ncbi:MAG: hypothetical protein MUP82_02095 [Candidatus Marinimicrobia bacterium]|nr:hypothetical protein [Candidatus Neomarinimicrobiota bacterium]